MSDDYVDIPYRNEGPSDPNNDADVRLWSDGDTVNGTRQNGEFSMSFDALDIGPNGERTIRFDSQLGTLVVVENA